MSLKNKKAAIVFVVVVLILVGLVLGILLTKRNRSHIELEVWPRSADDDVRLFIQYKSGNRSSWYPWVGKTHDFLKDYRKTNETRGIQNRVICNPQTQLAEKQVCDVPVTDFHPCTYSNDYNYENAAPCVFLKLNKILDWKPQPYNSTEDLPKNMPEDLKQHIRKISGKPEVNTVWVSCEGENPTDADNIGPVQYIPRRGFPGYYYPFTNKEGYLSPLVVVHFEKPKKGVVINVECKAWAKNIVYEHGGSVHFKLMVD